MKTKLKQVSIGVSEKKKFIFYIFCIILVIVMISGCTSKKEIEQLESCSKKYMIEHMYEKYDKDVKDEDIRDLELGYSSNALGNTCTGWIKYTLNCGTIVYVNPEKNIAYDTQEIEHLKEDIKNYIDKHKITDEYEIIEDNVSQVMDYSFNIEDVEGFNEDTRYSSMYDLQNGTEVGIKLTIYWKSMNDTNTYLEENQAFIDDLSNYFNIDGTSITSVVYRSDYYMNSEIKSVIKRNLEGEFYSNDSTIYNYIYIKNHIRKCFDGDDWSQTIRYPKYIEIEDGLEVSACTDNIIIKSTEDLVIDKVIWENKYNLSVEQIMSRYFETFNNPYLEGNFIHSGDGNYNIVDNLYFISYNNEIIDRNSLDRDEGVSIRIDKNKFQKGILKDPNYKVLMVYSNNPNKYPEVKYEDQYYEDDNTLYFFKENIRPFAVATKVN